MQPGISPLSPFHPVPPLPFTAILLRRCGVTSMQAEVSPPHPKCTSLQPSTARALLLQWNGELPTPHHDLLTPPSPSQSCTPHKAATHCVGLFHLNLNKAK